MSEQYTITIPVKSYNKRFLILNYGEPANLTKNPRLNNFFRRCLKKPSLTYDNTHYKEISKRHYSEKIEILITESDFYRHGWELSRTDTIAFNREIEEITKFFMRNTIALYENLMPQKDAIIRFQNQFGFHEDVWTYEAIKKDYFRNCVPHRVKILPEIIKKLEDFFLLKLSDLGTHSTLKQKSK